MKIEISTKVEKVPYTGSLVVPDKLDLPQDIIDGLIQNALKEELTSEVRERKENIDVELTADETLAFLRDALASGRSGSIPAEMWESLAKAFKAFLDANKAPEPMVKAYYTSVKNKLNVNGMSKGFLTTLPRVLSAFDAAIEPNPDYSELRPYTPSLVARAEKAVRKAEEKERQQEEVLSGWTL